jgi:signal transduction histidine kinase
MFSSAKKPYPASAIITVAATLARYALLPWLGFRYPLLTYWPAVEIVAYRFGFLPALFSIFLSLVFGRLFFMPSHDWLSVPPGELAFSFFFAVFSSSLALLMGSLRNARIKAEKAEAALAVSKQESLGVLSGGIAHDFNNLLTSILGYAGLLKTELAPHSTAAGYAANIELAAKEAAHLTRQMLAYSGQGSFKLEPVDLAGVVRKSLEALRPLIGPETALKLAIESGLPPVKADPLQAEQVSTGILLNAIEAIGADPGRIEVKLRPRGHEVVFEVKDTGCGMDEVTQARIFEPFFTTKFTGRGLGLAAVLGIVRAHGGTIQVESALGKGSVFQVYWPAKFDAIN